MRKSAREKLPASRILKAALDLFSSKGYEETKMKDIAQSVGLSVGALYLRFKSKEELCLALICDQTKDYEELTRRFSGEERDPDRLLKEYVEFCIEYAFKRKQLLSMFMREYRLPFISPMRKKFLKSQQEIIGNILRAGVQKGVFRPLDCEQTALMIFACIRGAVLMRIMFGVGTVTATSNSLFNLIAHGIRKERP